MKDDSEYPRPARCHICLGTITADRTVIRCECGKTFHDTCKNRAGECPNCGRTSGEVYVCRPSPLVKVMSLLNGPGVFSERDFCDCDRCKVIKPTELESHKRWTCERCGYNGDPVMHHGNSHGDYQNLACPVCGEGSHSRLAYDGWRLICKVREILTEVEVPTANGQPPSAEVSPEFRELVERWHTKQADPWHEAIGQDILITLVGQPAAVSMHLLDVCSDAIQVTGTGTPGMLTLGTNLTRGEQRTLARLWIMKAQIVSWTPKSYATPPIGEIVKTAETQGK